MYREPAGQELAGHMHYKVAFSAYEIFMNEQNIPIHKGIGVYDVRQLPMAPWKRMGGRGTFIELNGQAGPLGQWGMYVIEVPAGGVLNPERHMYEEIFLVIEGRGTTEIWREGSPKKQTFEWQAGAHFAVPLNVWHRLVNASSKPALVLAATSAPRAMNLYHSRSFIFDNPFEFPDRYDESEDYFKPRNEIEPDPEQGRAMLRSSLLPDIVHCYLPLDNQRAPGYRRIAPQVAGNTFFYEFIGEWPSGRYSKAHYHQAGAVLVCVKGKGYTYTWPIQLGPRPWEAGKGHLVKRQDYVPGGMVSAAPGGGDWFHQHFCTGKDPFRVMTIFSGWRREEERGGDEVTWQNVEIGQGGTTLSYRDEDPHIRKTYREALEREGVECQMPESLYK